MKRLLIYLPPVIRAVAGPYYLGYDCPDSCCDRVPECGDLPGTSDTDQTRRDLLSCLGAVPEGCFLDAHLGFVASGFDIYNHRVGRYETEKAWASTTAFSLEDLFRACPSFKPDPIGYIGFEFDFEGCPKRDLCVLYGRDTKKLDCWGAATSTYRTGEDLFLTSWPVRVPTDDGVKFTYQFSSHFISVDYSHLIFTLDFEPDGGGCHADFQEAEGVFMALTGVVKNIRKRDVHPENLRIGTPPLPTLPPPEETETTTLAAA